MIKNSSTLSHYLMEWTMIVVIDVVNKTGIFFFSCQCSFIHHKSMEIHDISEFINKSLLRTHLIKAPINYFSFQSKARPAPAQRQSSRADVATRMRAKWSDVQVVCEAMIRVLLWYIGFRIAIWRLFCKFLFYNFHKWSNYF